MAIDGIFEAEAANVVIRAQHALQTKQHAKKVLKTETHNKCRLCQQYDETVHHLVSACPILAK
jgi:hypothetical protein